MFEAFYSILVLYMLMDFFQSLVMMWFFEFVMIITFIMEEDFMAVLFFVGIVASCMIILEIMLFFQISAQSYQEVTNKIIDCPT